MAVDIRPIVASEFPEFYRAIIRGFGNDPVADDPDGEGLSQVLPPERTVAAVDGGRVVATLGDFDLPLYVPGGRPVPMAGTTVVTVAATHRRRGLLRAMMGMHLDVAAERGDPLAGLWASETPIYTRFGFGCAVDELTYELRGDQVVVEPPDDVTVEMLDTDDAPRVLPAVYERIARRHGTLVRNLTWWEHHVLRDRPHNRDGATAYRHVVARREGEAVGYTTYRQKQKWEDVPDGKVSVEALFAADTATRRALLWYLSRVDLYPNVRIWNQPVDDPLVWEVADRRRLRRELNDSLWLRLVDVAAALVARRYEADGRVVLHVDDPFRPAGTGTYELAVNGGEATCTRTTAEADASMDVSTLGALYLGGRSAVLLHRAGLIGGARRAMVEIDRLFRTTSAPWCPEVF